jgi:hypothetical protein
VRTTDQGATDRPLLGGLGFVNVGIVGIERDRAGTEDGEEDERRRENLETPMSDFDTIRASRLPRRSRSMPLDVGDVGVTSPLDGRRRTLFSGARL